MSDLNAQINVTNTIAVSVPASQGLTGPIGATGPTGATGAPGAAFEFSQGSASATWVIVHNLGKYPSVAVRDSSNRAVYGYISYDSTNQLTLTFANAFAGSAHLI